MNPGVEADDRFDPDQPPPPPYQQRPTPEPQRRQSGYERGLATIRAILREHGAPEHGPHYKPKKTNTQENP